MVQFYATLSAEQCSVLDANLLAQSAELWGVWLTVPLSLHAWLNVRVLSSLFMQHTLPELTLDLTSLLFTFPLTLCRSALLPISPPASAR